MAAKKLDFEVHCGPTLPTMVMGDSYRLRQILTHLLENALQFTKRGSVQMSAVLIEQNDETMHLRFAVEDTGIGIKPEDRAALFSLFSKLPTVAEVSTDFARSSRTGRGAGVGLAISQQLIELMGGEIKVESEYGRGSRFEASLALEKTLSMSSASLFDEGVALASPHPAQVALAPPSPCPADPPAATPTKGLHVLVVEDNELNSWVVCQLV